MTTKALEREDRQQQPAAAESPRVRGGRPHHPRGQRHREHHLQRRDGQLVVDVEDRLLRREVLRERPPARRGPVAHEREEHDQVDASRGIRQSRHARHDQEEGRQRQRLGSGSTGDRADKESQHGERRQRPAPPRLLEPYLRTTLSMCGVRRTSVMTSDHLVAEVQRRQPERERSRAARQRVDGRSARCNPPMNARSMKRRRNFNETRRSRLPRAGAGTAGSGSRTGSGSRPSAGRWRARQGRPRPGGWS